LADTAEMYDHWVSGTTGEGVTMLHLQPILVGTHITLRPLAVQDFHELFAVDQHHDRCAQGLSGFHF
jgi:hypothetical protein